MKSTFLFVIVCACSVVYDFLIMVSSVCEFTSPQNWVCSASLKLQYCSLFFSGNCQERSFFVVSLFVCGSLDHPQIEKKEGNAPGFKSAVKAHLLKSYLKSKACMFAICFVTICQNSLVLFDFCDILFLSLLPFCLHDTDFSYHHVQQDIIITIPQDVSDGLQQETKLSCWQSCFLPNRFNHSLSIFALKRAKPHRSLPHTVVTVVL